MALFEEMIKDNILEVVRSMGLKMDYDGKVKVPYHLELDQAWIYSNHCPERFCLMWKDIMFDRFRVIHPGCMSCWKIFYKPRTLEELFEIHDLQQKMIHKGIVTSSKCGVETRPYTGNLGGYAAFWYNPIGCGLEQARENTSKIRKLYKKNVRLKRGCTEMEQFTIQQIGFDSVGWNGMLNYTKDIVEKIEDTFVVTTEYRDKQVPEKVKQRIKRIWIEHARAHGDLSYIKYVEKEHMTPYLHLYDNSIDKTSEVDDGSIWKDYLAISGEKKRNNSNGREEKTLIASLEDI